MNKFFLFNFFMLFILLSPLQLQAITEEPQTLQKVRLQLNWKHQFEFSGYYAAIEQGFYAKRGLDIEIIEYNNNIDVINEVVSGKADYGTFGSQLLSKRLQGAPIILLANYFKRSPYVILTQQGISTFAELKNKRLMISDKDLKAPFIKYAFQKSGLISEKNITFVPHTFTITPFVNNDIDAMVAFLSNEPFLLNEQKKAYQQLGFSTYLPTIGQNFLFTSEKKQNKNSKQTRDFLKATNQGWQYALTHQDEIIELILEKYSNKKSRAALKFEAKRVTGLIMPNAFPIGSISVDRLRPMAEILLEMGEVENLERLNGFLLAPAKKEKVSLSKAEQQWLQQHPDITLGFPDNFPPFLIRDKKGQLTGFVPDYINLLNQQLGTQISLQTAATMTALGSKAVLGEIDGIAGAHPVARWAKQFNFSDVIVKTQQYLFVRNDNQQVDIQLVNLQEKSVGYLKGVEVSKEILLQHPEIKAVAYDNYMEMVNGLLAKEVEVLLAHIPLEYWRRNNTQLTFRLASIVKESNEDAVMLIRQDWSEFIPILNKGIAAIGRTQTNKLLKQWLGDKAVDFNKQQNNGLNLNSEEKQWIKAHPTINYCFSPLWEPYDFRENGQHQGIFADYLKLLEQRIGVSLTPIHSIDWKQALSYAKQRDCDLVSGAVPNKNRKEFLAFSTPYFDVTQVLVARSDRAFVSSIEDIKNETISVPPGSAIEKFLQQKYPEMDIAILHTYEMRNQLKSGNVYAFVVPLEHALRHAEELSINFKIIGKLDIPYPISVAVRNDAPILLAIINKALASINQTDHSKISRKWNRYTVQQQVDYSLLWQIFAVIAMLFIVILAWNYALKRKVVERTLELQHHQENLEELIATRTTELRESEEMFRAIFEHAPVLIDSFDKNGQCTLWNNECKKLFGYTMAEVNAVAKPLSLFYPDDATCIEVIKSVNNTPDSKFKEWHPYTKSGKKLSVYWANFMISNDIIINIGYDMTEQKFVEQQLIEAQQASETANQAKSIFLANMSHEIRTPMNAILGFTDILERMETNSQKTKYLQIIQSSGQNLLNIINDILNLSKIEAGKMELQYSAMSISRLFHEVQQVFSQKIADKNLLFECVIDENLPESFIFDESRLRQVLINLIGNSIKFTHQGFIKLSLDLQFSEQSSKNQVNLIITVADSGIGIPKNQQDTIFQSFSQVKGQKETLYAGTGLGLTIAKRIMELANGTISLESEEGVGTSFCLFIPNVDVTTKLEALPSQTFFDISMISFLPMTILIADDVDYNREILATYLADWEFELHFVENGRQAIEKACEIKPDIILLDMKMPVMDGYEAAEKLKSIEETVNIPIIAITAFALTQDEQQIRANCEGYLRKPVSRVKLIKELIKLLPNKVAAQKINEEKPQVVEPVILTKQAVSQLPIELQKELKLAIACVNIEEINQLLQQISQKNSLLAKGMQHHIDNFEYEILLRLLDE